MRIDYAREKLGVAVEYLVGPATIKERLDRAWLECHVLRPEDFPPTAQQRFAKIRAAMTANGTYQASIAAMSDAQAGDVALQIRELEEMGEWPHPFVSF